MTDTVPSGTMPAKNRCPSRRRPEGPERMRLLFLGDVVGRPGREAVTGHLPGSARFAGLSIASSSTARMPPRGFGIRRRICEDLIAEFDAITLGNHLSTRERSLHRARTSARASGHLPSGTPGRGATMVRRRAGPGCFLVNAKGTHLHGCEGFAPSPGRERSRIVRGAMA